mgnify:CR=1 FL=1
MKGKRTGTVEFRRKREGKTDYRKRISLIKSGKARVVVRKSLKNTTIQIVKYKPEGDLIIAGARSDELKKHGLKTQGGNIPCAYLTGLLAGKKAAEKGVKEGVADTGTIPSTKGSRVYAALKGVIDSGISISLPDEMIPEETTLDGGKIDAYAKKLEADGQNGRFSEYEKNKINASEAKSYFESIKKSITGGS